MRIPKAVLALSGLEGTIQMEVKKGQIILRKSQHVREGWREHITQTTTKNQQSLGSDHDLDVWEVTTSDGLEAAD